MSNVVLHLVLGGPGDPAALVHPGDARGGRAVSGGRAGGYLPRRARKHHAASGGIAGAYHVAALALLAFLPYVLRRTGESFRNAYVACLALLVLFPAAAALYRKAHPDADDRIRNPLIVPASMDEEGGGPQSPFFPSSAKTNVGGIIPSNFFMDSEACGECHKDIYEQWKSSMHHFASFNNQFYRKSIEYMQSVDGTQPSKWCAGCHDHAVFFNGRFDRPINEQIDTPEAQAGLALHVLPRHHTRGQHHGKRRFHHANTRRCTNC